VSAMRASLAELAAGRNPRDGQVAFADLRRILGFDAYDVEAARYSAKESEVVVK